MSTILTPSRSTTQLKRYISTSQTNRELQYSLKKANIYSLLVNQHLVKSQEENYALKTVTKSYSEKRIYRIYSRSNSLKKTPKNSANETKKQIQVPEDFQMVDALNKKAGLIPDLRQKFEQEMYVKLMLEQKIHELKSKIYEERKTKDKIHLRNCKLINQYENSFKNTQILKEQSRQNLTLTCILASECSQLDLQVDQTQKMNKKINCKIEQEQQKVSKLKQQIQNTKIVFDQKSSRVSQLKQTQTIIYKKMTNIYMWMNQLKQQKARLLSNILADVQNHS